MKQILQLRNIEIGMAGGSQTVDSGPLHSQANGRPALVLFTVYSMPQVKSRGEGHQQSLSTAVKKNFTFK